MNTILSQKLQGFYKFKMAYLNKYINMSYGSCTLVLNMYMKFHDDILNGFKVIKRTLVNGFKVI